MSTKSVTPAASAGGALATILGGLAQTNMVVSLGLQIGGIVIPLVKGLVSEIKQISTGQKSVTYQVLIITDEANLQQIDASSIADLVAENAELTRMGKTPLPVPATVLQK